MNNSVILSNLREAHDQLTEIIEVIDSDPFYDEALFMATITHLYHHINSAWNARNVTVEQWSNLTEEQFFKWRSFPKDIDMGPR